MDATLEWPAVVAKVVQILIAIDTRRHVPSVHRRKKRSLFLETPPASRQKQETAARPPVPADTLSVSLSHQHLIDRAAGSVLLLCRCVAHTEWMLRDKSRLGDQ